MAQRVMVGTLVEYLLGNTEMAVGEFRNVGSLISARVHSATIVKKFGDAGVKSFRPSQDQILPNTAGTRQTTLDMMPGLCHGTPAADLAAGLTNSFGKKNRIWFCSMGLFAQHDWTIRLWFPDSQLWWYADRATPMYTFPFCPAFDVAIILPLVLHSLLENQLLIRTAGRMMRPPVHRYS